MTPSLRPSEAARCAVVDLGSNSVRLVVYEGRGRNPMAIFNEKATPKLGRGMQATGRLNEAALGQTARVVARYAAIARAMGADPFEVLATAAVRDASNGPPFVADLERRIADAGMPGTRIRVLSGEEEAALSSDGVLCGFSGADGLLADIGGGSLELVQMDAGQARQATTLRLGVIRLAERSNGDLVRARAIADGDLASVPWLDQAAGRDLFLVGGAWRALARAHMELVGYPLNVVHHYAIGAEAARSLAALVLDSPKKGPERLAKVPRRRAEDLPYAATVLRRLLRRSGARRVVFSANGIREGWFMALVPPEVRAEDPVLAAAEGMAARFGREMALPPALAAWTAPLFEGEGAGARRLRHAACWLSDTGSLDHPEYRADQSFWRVLRQPGVALDHQERAFLALAVALRYEAEADAPFMPVARALLDEASASRAMALGAALRLAYTVSAGTPALLAAAALRLDAGRLVLRLDGAGVFAGEGVERRLERLAAAMGVGWGMEAV